MKTMWPNVRLGDVCIKIGSGATPKGGKETYSSTGPFSLIRSQNVLNDRFSYDGLARISEQQAQKLDGVSVETKDVLLNITGDSVARSCMVTDDVLPARVNQHVAIIRPKPDILDALFLRYFFISSEQQAIMLGLSGSGATRNALTKGMIEGFSIPLPPLPEQKAIARILGSLDDKIELNRRMNATLEAMAQTLFRAWFVDFEPVKAKVAGLVPVGMDAETAALFPSDFEESSLGLIPKGWKVGNFKDCCKRVENGGTPSRKNADYWNPPEVPWLTSGEVRKKIVLSVENGISKLGLENSSAKIWPENTTVVALYGATAGQVCFLGSPMCSNQACCGLIPKANWHFYVYLKASSSIQALENQASGSAQQNLSQQIVANFPCMIPPQNLMVAFDKNASPIFEHWLFNLRQSQTLAQIRDSLLPRLISGQLRVPDAEAFIAEVNG